MDRRYRLFLLFLSLSSLILIGRFITGDFTFITSEFWFSSGILLLILLSLIDQPFFSTEANVFINSVTGWMSLLLIPKNNRTAIWIFFFCGCLFLIMYSYFLLWYRKFNQKKDNRFIVVSEKIITKIGRPEIIFSSFFLWSVINKFGINSYQANSFFLFWAIFIILSYPYFAKLFAGLLIKKPDEISTIASITGIADPSIAFIKFNNDIKEIVYEKQLILKHRSVEIGKAVLIDDRIVNGSRQGKIAITNSNSNLYLLSDADNNPIEIYLSDENADTGSGVPISVVDSGTKLGKLSFLLPPRVVMEEGEIVWVDISGEKKGYYQIISAELQKESVEDNNFIYNIKVTAGQLGIWDNKTCRFETITWIPKSGNLIFRTSRAIAEEIKLPCGQLEIGNIPNTYFPIHVNLNDVVTHNTSIIGVTGSGKSYLAFNLIEELAKNNIKILILDISRQHWLYLNKRNKLTALKNEAAISAWISDRDSHIGIYQFADAINYTEKTASFVKEAFNIVSQTKLSAGKNEPAKLCVVFEEAHSLIPEWNQVANRNDPENVNQTARFILQGRKYGMGCIVISQRTANVTKTILNQCNTIIALQSFDQTGLDFLKNYMGEDYASTISTLPTRHAILVGKASSSKRPVLFKVKELIIEEEPISESQTTSESKT